jgi:ABC-2 type transport system ATP-binding protein
VTACIEVSNLTKRFGDVVAVDGASFAVEQGSVVGFLGPNGAGKSTTLRILLGLTRATSGTATVNGVGYDQVARPRHVVGAVLEAVGAYPGRSARNHLRIEALAADVEPARVDEVLDLVGLRGAAGRRVGGFSLGMRQRLNLATALLGDPQILVLDEPTNGLDPEGMRWIRRLVRDLAAEGRTVLISSHILAEVSNTVDQVIVMDRGRVLAQSALADLDGSLEEVFLRLTGGDEDPGRDLSVPRSQGGISR